MPVSTGRCSVSPGKARALAAQFTELHEGLAEKKIACEPYHGPVLPVRKLGLITEIQYHKSVTDGRYPYHHPFAPHAQPTFGLDRLGIPVIWAGRYHVTTHGIEDWPASKVRPERLSGTPTALTQLGTLEFIRYAANESGVLRVRTLRFTGLTLEHDPQGNLHILRTKTPPRKGLTMKRRHNPSTKEMTKTAGKVLVGALVGGAAIMAADKILSPRVAGYKKAGIELATALVGAGLLVKFKAPPQIVFGVGTGVGSLALLDGYKTWNAAHPMPVAPGHYALGPGGLPQGYGAVNRAGCAVPR